MQRLRPQGSQGFNSETTVKQLLHKTLSLDTQLQPLEENSQQLALNVSVGTINSWKDRIGFN